jgi:micrococcal nuclease
MILALAALLSAHCVAVDGDSLSCLVPPLSRVHLRLNGIDSPELPGHCRAGRQCAPGDPVAAKANLARLIDGRTVHWTDLGTDRYGRTIAAARVGHRDLSCAQLIGKYAIYKPRWDNLKATRKRCPRAAR